VVVEEVGGRGGLELLLGLGLLVGVEAAAQVLLELEVVLLAAQGVWRLGAVCELALTRVGVGRLVGDVVCVWHVSLWRESSF